MIKRGPVPRGKVKIKWSPAFAYAIGLLTTDGNLSSDGRHISFASSDKKQVETFKRCLVLDNRVGQHHSGTTTKRGFRIQFGDVIFYQFLQSIGLMPNKSKIVHKVKIPPRYFFDFLRGHFDGDGCFYSYWDPRWRSSFMFYTTLLSASKNHIDWLQKEIFRRLRITGHITKSRFDSTYCLKYAKAESVILLPRLYRNSKVYLVRKHLKIKKALDIIGKSQLV